MSLWQKTVVKIWDGFAKAVGASLAAGLGALCLWAFGIIALVNQVGLPDPGYTDYAPAYVPDYVLTYVPDYVLTYVPAFDSTFTPKYDYTYTPSKKR